jgi:hypothetical protein
MRVRCAALISRSAGRISVIGEKLDLLMGRQAADAALNGGVIDLSTLRHQLIFGLKLL